MRILACMIGLAALFGTTIASADTTLVYNANGKTIKMRIHAGSIRIDDTGPRWLLYRQTKNTLYSVNPRDHSYIRIDADTANTLRMIMQTLREQATSRLSTLMPEKRAAARDEIAEELQLSIHWQKTQQINIKKTDDNARVADITCRIVVVERTDNSGHQLCVAEPETLGMTEPEFAAVQSMFALMRNLLAGTGREYMGLPYIQLEGMPIRYPDASNASKHSLSQVSHEKLSKTIFTIPDKYQEQPLYLDG